MTPRYRQEHFWNAIIRPILWPLILVQMALVMLCVVIGLTIWGATPGEVAWSVMLWLTLALLIGSGMNVAVLLTLIKTRAKRREILFMQELAELEHHAEMLHQERVRHNLPAQPTPLSEKDQTHPLQRIQLINKLMADVASAQERMELAASSQELSKQDQALLDDLHHQQKQLKHLMAGRDRAREESRLKSEYLTLLQKEADSLFEHVGGMLQDDASEANRHWAAHVKERLADIRVLLANFVQQDDHPIDAVTEPVATQPLRVLVVDDGPVNLMLARQMLESKGLYVEGVSSGEQALERQPTARFDLVFMDIFMPTLNGFETTQRWREFERATGSKRSIIIALTANVDNTDHATRMAAGLDDVLAKPYQPEALLSMVTKWLPDVKNETSDS